MPLDEILRRIVAVPFQSFTIHMADGRQIPVAGRDFIMIPPEKGQFVAVFQKDGALDLLDVILITGLSFAPIADTSPSN